MVVGICRVHLHLPGNRSLKGKRQVVRRICDRIRHRFHLSIAEVDDQDLHQRAQLGIAVVSNDDKIVDALVRKVLQAIEDMQLAPILNHEFEIQHYGDHLGGSDDYFDDEDDEFAGQSRNKGWDYLDEWK